MIKLELNRELEQGLQQIANRRGEAAADLAERVLYDFVRQATGPPSELELIQEINRGLPETTRKRYDQLMEALRNGAMTQEEHEELKTLTNEVEMAHARRLEQLIQLAELRRVSLDTVIAEFGLRSRTCANE